MSALKHTRWIAGIIFVVFLLCTIKDDNGNPAIPEISAFENDTSSFTGSPSIFATLDSAYVFPDDTIEIRVQVFADMNNDDSLEPLASFPLIARTTRGHILEDTLRTNNNGRVVFQFTDSVTGTVELTVTAADVQQTVRFEVTETPIKVQKLLQAMPGSAIIKADGTDTTTIAVSVLNDFRNPIVGECVQFITTAGSIKGLSTGCSNSGQSKTGDDGIARALLTSSNVNDTAFVTAYLVSDQSLSDEVEVAFKGMTIELEASKTNLKTGDTSVITATVVNASGYPVGKTPIFFAREDGSESCISVISKDSVTNYEGVATFRIRGSKNGSDNILISAAGTNTRLQINVSTLLMELTIDKTILQTTVNDTAFVTALFTNASGDALSNRTIRLTRTFKTEDESDTSDVITKKTNSSGTAAFPIPALLWEGKMRLSFTGLDNTEGYASIDTVLQFITTRIMSIRSPQPIPADGVSRGPIQVFIKNKSGNPIVGDFIKFTTTAGTITSKSQTNENGKATVYLISDRRNILATVTATLESDPTKKISCSVEFKGVTINAVANPPSIRSNGSDSSKIIINLEDAAKIPITGEHINISRQQNATSIRHLDSVTNNDGEIICIASGTGSGQDTLTISAAGADTRIVLNYSENILQIDTAAGQICIADSTDSTLITVRYVKGDNTSPVANATLEIAATIGTMDTIFAQKYTTDSQGKVSFYLRNPHFAATANITGIAHSNGEMTSGSFQLYFKANLVKFIELSGTPEVITTNGGKAKLEAIAFDKNKNRVKDARLSFNIVNGPSGGEYLDPPTAITGDDGMATTYLVSGKTPSQYQEVWITAGSFSAIKSDTVKFTIVGPPCNINIGTNIEKGENPNDGTFLLPCAAIVTDVNGNPVADGTEVTFSLLISGLVTYRTYIGIDDVIIHYNDSTSRCTFRYDTSIIPVIHYFEDFNNNFRLDPGEDRNNDGILNRGENVNGDQDPVTGKDKWVRGPSFFDINNDGARQYDRRIPVEPYAVCDGNPKYVDLNGNQSWDPIEPLSDNNYYNLYIKLVYDSVFWKERFAPGSLTPQQLADLQALDDLDSIYALGEPYDIDATNYGVCDPNTAVSITRTVTTQNGKALNKIIYGQSDARNIEVMINAESKGIRTKSPETIILPIISSGE